MGKLFSYKCVDVNLFKNVTNYSIIYALLQAVIASF